MEMFGFFKRGPSVAEVESTQKYAHREVRDWPPFWTSRDEIFVAWFPQEDYAHRKVKKAFRGVTPPEGYVYAVEDGEFDSGIGLGSVLTPCWVVSVRKVRKDQKVAA